MDAYAAQADAAAVEGRLREPFGGKAATLRGIRVMSSGLAEAQFNSAVVTSADADLEGARAFYGALPWGMRVPVEIPWDVGRRLLRQPLMGLLASDLVAPAEVPGLTVRLANASDLEVVLAVDAEAFEHDAEPQRPWAAPHLGAAGIEVALAVLDGEPVATAYAVASDGEAGPAVLLGGVAVRAAARRRGVGAYVSWWLLHRGVRAGARFAHLHADTPAAARVYARLGFAAAGALDIYEE